MLKLSTYKLYKDVETPVFETELAACFDLKAYLKHKEYCIIYNTYNVKISPEFYEDTLILQPGNRALIPTGLIFDIPIGYSLRLHVRSGIALKYGLTLANCEGIIDADYTKQVYLTLLNTSNTAVNIEHGNRICQAELIKQQKYDIVEVSDKPENKKSSRTGGFGSTGV